MAGEQPSYGPETVDTAWLAVRAWLAPRLLNGDIAGFSLPGDVSPSARNWAHDVVRSEWTMESGKVRAPAGQGSTSRSMPDSSTM